MTRTAQALLTDLIRCPSVTPETAGVFDVLEAFLTPFGFSVERPVFEGDGSYPVENLFATRTGARAGPHLLFAGHTDVVPPGDAEAWHVDPFGAEVREGVMYGRGATDMKSGVAAFCAALAELHRAGALESGTVSLAITNDEEADSINGTAKLMAWAQEQGHRFDFAIVGEPSSAEDLGDSIKIGRRGSFSGVVTVRGVQGHAAYPERAHNPLPVVAAIATAIDQPYDTGTEHFQPTNLEITSIDTGNPTTNVIPGKTTLRFNVRFNDNWTAESLRAEIERRIATAAPPDCPTTLEIPGIVSRVFLCEAGADVERLTAAVEAVTGRRPALSTGGGTSDGRFISQYCPVVECGLVGRTMHQVDECVPLADLEGLAAIYARFVRDYVSGGTA